MAKRKSVKDTEIKRIADRLRRLADQAGKRHMLLRTKAMLAKIAWENGASIDSLADKMKWRREKLIRILEPDVDIPIRDLSDVATAMNRQIHFAAEKIPEPVR